MICNDIIQQGLILDFDFYYIFCFFGIFDFYLIVGFYVFYGILILFYIDGGGEGGRGGLFFIIKLIFKLGVIFIVFVFWGFFILFFYCLFQFYIYQFVKLEIFFNILLLKFICQEVLFLVLKFFCNKFVIFFNFNLLYLFLIW